MKSTAHCTKSNCCFHKLWNTQAWLFVLFVTVLIIPNLFLLYTEPYSVFGGIASLLIPLGIYLCLFSLTSKPGIMAFICFLFLFFGAFQLVLLYLFGESIIAVDMFTNLFTTDPSEAGELLDSLWPAVVGVCVLYLPTLVLAGRSMKLKTKLTASFRKKWGITGLGIALLGLGIAGGVRAVNHSFSIRDHVFPANVIYNLKLSLERWSESLHYSETSQGFTFNATKIPRTNQREIYVFVIGEAARATNWSLFGYPRETTPRLAKRTGLVGFSDVLTQSNATHKSVPIILSAASAENHVELNREKSLITAFKETGFQTVFLSNQVPNRSYIDYFGTEADYSAHQSKWDATDSVAPKGYDGEFLPVVQKWIDSTAGNLLIVLHTRGSHFDYRARYPETFAAFKPDFISSISQANKEAIVNAYDNSIRYTDYVVDSLIGILERSGQCTGLFYISDHGEDLLDDDRGRFLHASPIPTYYQLHIASLAWFSPNYIEKFSEKYAGALTNRKAPASSADAFHTFLDLADIHTPKLDTTRSLLRLGFTVRERTYLNDHGQPMLFYNTGLKPTDFKALDRYHIYYDKSKRARIRH